ncbi:hypothetical protein DFR52_101395 [Hoeflea marina]|uniref:SMODS and SLOG-associating 2TM effector domain-containing protein n=1 Tax=Hoeflea marina TaxID=274592 RepID=A0A317PRA2_9HYPH|nr:hypothetical protein [Hoeflea marina]PWW03709.1 hypothetical protein DFR52_101395 [Hoeflea marina]
MNAVTDADIPGPIAAMNLRIAFAGMREMGAERELFAQRLDETYRALAAVAASIGSTPVEGSQGETVLQAHADALPGCDGVIGLTLLTGFADGADRIAARRWRGLGLGDLHAVFPFRDPPGGEPVNGETYAWTHGPDTSDTAYRVDLNSPGDLDGGFDRYTVLDGAESAKEKPPRHGHLEQTRFLARWADVAVVAWDGEAAAGPGGTADMVALCLARRMPIIWINPNEAGVPIRQIFPDEFWSDVHFGEFLHSLRTPEILDLNAPPLDTTDLLRRLLPDFMPPKPVAAHHEPPRSGANEAGVDSADAKRMLHAAAHGEEPDLRHRYASDGDRTLPGGRLMAAISKQLWSIFYKHPGGEPPAAGPGAANHGASRPVIHSVIETAFRTADERASVIGDAHRGTQIFILMVAPLAVLLATMPGIHPAGKFWYVLLELLLIWFAYTLHKNLVDYGSHHYWSDVRRLAERLRVLRATWPLAFDVADARADPPETWTEWLARAVRRAAGPPCKLLDIDRKRNAIRFAQHDPEGIVNNQFDYQTLTALRAGKLHRRLHGLETRLFRILVGCLAVFLAWYVLGPQIPGWGKPPSWVGGLVMIASAVIPVIAAICLAIEAKFDLHESSTKARGLAGQFSRVSERIAMERNQSRDEELLREAALILLNDVDKWREGALRRAPAVL